MRKKIYETVHIYNGNAYSVLYKWLMIGTIILSFVPLTTKDSLPVFKVTDMLCLVIFVSDFVLRWISADYKFNCHHFAAFLRYPFRLISVIDLLSIFSLLCPLFGWFNDFAFTGILKVFRIVRILRYSSHVRVFLRIFQNSKKALLSVGSLAIGYILTSALIIFNVEPASFPTFFDAVYWATVSLTTVGYGDIYPVSSIGRCIAMASSFFGIAIVALPAGIMTAEYMKSVQCDCKPDSSDENTPTFTGGNKENGKKEEI